MSVESVNASATPPSSLIGSRSQSLDQADFLKMLTAELQAQDPMNPMSNADFATQLAQFSSLQQLQGMSGTLDQSLQATLLLGQVFNNTMATSLIGKEIRAQANTLNVSASGTAQLNYNLAANAAEVTIEITDSNGSVVRTINADAQSEGEQTVEWDGLNSEGQHVAEGDYTFSVAAADADGNPITASTYFEGIVSEVKYVDGQVVLVVGGHEVSLSDILLIREPGDETKKG